MTTSRIANLHPSSVTTLNPTPEQIQVTAKRASVVNRTALSASGSRVRETGKVSAPGRRAKSAEWISDAWEMYDQTGELHFLINMLAQHAGKARFFVGEVPEDPTADVAPTEDESVPGLLAGLLEGTDLPALVERYTLNQAVTGDGYILMLPASYGEPGDYTRREAGQPDAVDGIAPVPVDDGTDPRSASWHFLSTSEVVEDPQAGTVTLQLIEGPYVVKPDQVFLLRVWRPHPREVSLSDSAVRSSLPVLRELAGLTQHVSAQVDSRLAGAGILLVPSEADQAWRQEAGLKPEDPSPLVTELVETASTAIGDRSSAAAMVPIVATMKAEWIEKVKHITFSTPLDKETQKLREEALTRLAMGLECPPELLTGVGGMNHWGAWLVREDVIGTHLEPFLARLCSALTRAYLWPALEQMGRTPAEARRYMLAYSVEHLIVRPNRATEAATGYAAGVISDVTYRTALGYGDDDAPEAVEVDQAVTMALEMAKAAPSLAQVPGLPDLAAQIRSLLTGEGYTPPEVDETETDSGTDIMPTTDGDDAPTEETA